jgi:hypothetical protein
MQKRNVISVSDPDSTGSLEFGSKTRKAKMTVIMKKGKSCYSDSQDPESDLDAFKTLPKVVGKRGKTSCSM